MTFLIDIEEKIDRACHLNGTNIILIQNLLNARISKTILKLIHAKKIERAMSQINSVEAGVPKGSLLGPIIFMHADDTVLYSQ